MNPPKLALLLLRMLGPGREAVTGDLVEEFQFGVISARLNPQSIGVCEKPPRC
jgi:hypothetical protein